MIESIRKLDRFRCDAMEDFGARSEVPAALCEARVRACDVFVVIVGHCYGESPPGSTTSYTELEYQCALDAKKPCLVFFAPDDFPMPANLGESATKKNAQIKFRKRLRRETTIDSFDSPSDLARRVVIALSNLVTASSAPDKPPESGRPIEHADKPESAALEQRRDSFQALLNESTTPLLSVRALIAARAATYDAIREAPSTHEANFIFRFRESLQLDWREKNILIHAFLLGGGTSVPGWYWLRDEHDLPGTLLFFANTVLDSRLRAHALRLLGRIGVEFTNPEFAEFMLGPLLRDEDSDVRRATLDLIERAGDEALLEIASTAGVDPRLIALTRARIAWRKRSAVEEKRLFDELLEAGAPESPRARELGEASDGILEAVLKHPSEEICFAVVGELARRSRSNVAEEALARLGSGKFNYEPLFVEALRQSTFEALRDRVEWYGVRGYLVYRVLAEDHFDKFGHQVRADLRDRFKAFRFESTQRDIDEYLENRFTEAAMCGLAKNGGAQDVDLAREVLRHRIKEHYSEGHLQAIELLAKFGSAEDVALLAPFFDVWQETRLPAVDAALRLAADPTELARSLLGSNRANVIVRAIAELAKRAPETLREILSSKHELARKHAALHLARTLPPEQVAALLREYHAQRSYYYNVVCIFDRYLSAPPELREEDG